MKQIVSTDSAPKAIGPYSQAVVHNGIAYLSGQIAIDPATNTLIDGDISAQTERVLKNIEAVLTAAGASLDSALKVTVFLKDMANFPKMNEVYARYFGANPPARSTVEAARLPRDVEVEIDVIAAVSRLLRQTREKSQALQIFLQGARRDAPHHLSLAHNLRCQDAAAGA